MRPMYRLARTLAPYTPYVGRLIRERDALRKENERLRAVGDPGGRECRQFVPPGHFYSPIPALDAIRACEARIFHRGRRDVPGIDLNEEEQLALLRSFIRYYAELPFPERPTRESRYFFENPAYSYSDAIFLFCMLRHSRPRRVIEVGSGYSSCVTLDTSDRFFGGQIACTFIEPYPDLLLSLLGTGDAERIEIVRTQLQDVPVSRFTALQAGDILFIDSTHVAKVGSDVNYLFFEVLPRLAPGVLIHFHDIFYPFEYPKEWIYEGRSWTEGYVLRAFLQFNPAFKIVLFGGYLHEFHREFLAREMPLSLRNPGGSIWLQRVG